DEDADLYDADGLSDLDRELVRLRGKLEKKYQNDHNAGYTYIDPAAGTSYPLTPQMMKEWCRAMVYCQQYDGEATLNEPPNFITDFDPANRQVALHPTRIAAGANRPAGIGPPQGLSDIGHLATILTAVIGHGGQGIPNPKRIGSPVLPTPSKLPRFLQYASTDLGIASAPIFESAMRRNGFGPDILHLLEDRDLTELGMKKGDVIRLKAGAPSWNGPDARKKHMRADMEATSASGSSSGGFDPATPPSKKVTFKRRYDNGDGAMRFYGP
ncbi:hypothetical protein B0H13DRAFT_2532181, partial [Mycena leptocephala]